MELIGTHGMQYPSCGDPDLTETTINEYYFGHAQNRQVCFISAGPDGLFGTTLEFSGLAGLELQRAIEAARSDNIYSYPVTFSP